MNLKRRGNAATLDAVLHPGGVEPFPGIEHAGEFHRAWERKQDWVLANLTHAAYKPSSWVLRKLTQFGAIKTRIYSAGGAQAFLSVFDGYAVLAFGGTQVLESADASDKAAEAARRLTD